MHENTETPEDVDRQLATARRILQDFEDGVDRQRLLLRLRTASPAHPVLLFRFAFAASVVLLVATAIVVMVITQVNSDLARILAKFEMVLPLPEEIPALPAVLALLAAFMGFGWVMATFAALALGRDAQMLPWEQKQHQKLVNEVTRLTTQKAVMERIRNTPAGARPRIATPVPVGARRSVPTPSHGATLSQGTPTSTRSGNPDPSTVPIPASTQGGIVRGGIGRTPSAGTSYTPPPSSLAPPRPAVTPAPGGFGARAIPSRTANDRGGELTRGNPLPTPVATPLPAPIRPAGAVGRSASAGVPAVVAPHRAGPTGPSGPSADVRTPITGNPVRTSGPSHGPSAGKPAGSPARAPIPRPKSTEVQVVTRAASTPEPSPARPSTLTPVGSPSRPAIVMPLASSRSAEPTSDPSMNGGRHHGHGQNGKPNGAQAVGVRLGVAAAAASQPEVDADDETLLNDEMETTIVPTGGILGRARAGVPLTNRSTPYGSAGRVRLPPSPATLRLGATSTASLGQSTRGGTPLGAPPKAGVPVGQAKPRLVAGSAPSTARASERPGPAASMFATPLPPSRTAEDFATTRDVAARDVAARDVAARNLAAPDFETYTPGPEVTAEVVLDEDSQDGDYADDGEDEVPTSLAATSRDVPTVELDHYEDAWLADALAKADALVRSFPPQATLELSREPNLPFTLVISRATPAMAVRAMVNFVEFLASIATPPRARIELLGVAHLDRSFHKNVEAALEPYFGGNLEVRPGPGQVDIRFTDPDPQWGAYPRLPR